MPSLRRLLLLTLPLVTLVLAKNQPEPSGTENEKVDHHTFQDLLNALPEESLHAALHDHHPQFQDGVFESDRQGVESVHCQDPPLATKLLEAARLDLLKRQAPAATNGSSAAPPPQSTEASSVPASSAPPASSAAPPSSAAPGSSAPPQTSNPPAPSSSAPLPVVISIRVSTTDSAGKPSVFSTAILSKPTVTVAVPVTTTDSAGKTIVATTQAPGIVVTSTDSAGSTFVTTAPASLAPTPGQVLTETDAHGSTFLTTYTPDGGAVSSIVLITTTKPDGTPQTLTSYAYVGASGTNTVGGGNGQATSTKGGKPGLQTGAAGVLSRRWGVEAAAVVGGAVGVAWFI